MARQPALTTQIQIAGAGAILLAGLLAVALHPKQNTKLTRVDTFEELLALAEEDARTLPHPPEKPSSH